MADPAAAHGHPRSESAEVRGEVRDREHRDGRALARWATPILHGSPVYRGRGPATGRPDRSARRARRRRRAARRSGRARSPCPRRSSIPAAGCGAARRSPSSGLIRKWRGPSPRRRRRAQRALMRPAPRGPAEARQERRRDRRRRPCAATSSAPQENCRELAVDGDLLAGRGGVGAGTAGCTARSSADPDAHCSATARSEAARPARGSARDRDVEEGPHRGEAALDASRVRGRGVGGPGARSRRDEGAARRCQPQPLVPPNRAAALLQLGLRFSLNRKHMFGRGGESRSPVPGDAVIQSRPQRHGLGRSAERVGMRRGGSFGPALSGRVLAAGGGHCPRPPRGCRHRRLPRAAPRRARWRRPACSRRPRSRRPRRLSPRPGCPISLTSERPGPSSFRTEIMRLKNWRSDGRGAARRSGGERGLFARPTTFRGCGPPPRRRSSRRCFLRPRRPDGDSLVDPVGAGGEPCVGVDADAYAAWVLTDAPPAAPRRRFHQSRRSHTEGMTASA